MGTNYYARVDACPTCGHGSEIHIGKSSGGWTFSFHAVGEWEIDEGIPIRSYQDWVRFLERENVRIFNEYDEEISIDNFKELVESKKSEKYNHTTYCQKEYPQLTSNFLDPEGHSFSEGEFS